MNPTLIGLIAATLLFFGVLGLMFIGRRIGKRWRQREGEGAEKGFGAMVGAIFALMGLVLAFLFSGSLSRFDARRHLMVEEANAIGTAWLRVDLLPPETQPKVRDLFRRYTDQRLGLFQNVRDIEFLRSSVQEQSITQKEIWTLAASASAQGSMPASAPVLVLPSLNAMFDIATTQNEMVRAHPPRIIFFMLGVLALSCSLFAGYDLAARPGLDPLHSLAFAAILSVTVYVIVDLEYPRLGLFTMRDSDQVLIDLRKSME